MLAAMTTAVALGGCGGGEDEEEGSGGGSMTVSAGEAVEVTGGDYFFDPSTITVEGGGGEVELTLQNDGSLPHNLTVFEGEEEVGGTETFEAGGSETAAVELDPGTYQMICTVGNHEELGMTGEIEVP